ncbi:MAG: DUF268 domain-containing protein [Desulfuromonadaceae bacterium]|nr:DUF268 domain-containing protein [Desulfuromonadaceae bacterium]
MLRLINKFLSQLIDIRRLILFPYRFAVYCNQFIKYAVNKETQEKLHFSDFWPILTDNTGQSQFDSHYTYLNYWALEKIKNSVAPAHIDVGSQIGFVTLLSLVKPVTFIDIRPLEISMPGLTSKKGSILSLPFGNNSVASISSLHVIEHIGLGRYGDPIDPKGTQKAIDELSRVVAPGGDLYVAVPVGVSRTCFNAHRILNPSDIVGKFASNGIELKDFCVVTDNVEYLIDKNPADFVGQHYACGMFHFVKSQTIGADLP